METAQTPRLCIDGRAAQEFPAYGMLVGELIDQWVCSEGGDEASCDWVDKKRTVLLSHPDQAFAGQLRRFNTERKIGRTPLYWGWERNFVKNSNISAFHRFRPANWVSPDLSCATLTTLFPPVRGHLKIKVRTREHFVVPSLADKQKIQQAYGVQESQIYVVRPCTRRFVHFSEPAKRQEGGWILCLLGNENPPLQLDKLLKVLSYRFPKLIPKPIRIHKDTKLSPSEWIKYLRQTQVCLYLTQTLCDWPNLALEALFFQIPTLFLDGHSALEELLPNSSLRLSRFLVDQPSASQLNRAVMEGRASLTQSGVFEPLGLVKQYRQIYQSLGEPENFTSSSNH